MDNSIPQNAGYLIAAYILVPTILIAYAVSLYRRSLRP
jgi:hypothetical protein